MSKKIYQVKVTLKGSKPPIWRRLEVEADTRLDRLHDILQVAMGWTNSHLHQFIVGRTFYGELHPDYDGWGADMLDEKKVKLSQLATREGFKFIYEYDFGDSWEHELLLEKILVPEVGINYPRCVKGKRACPPEDVGGVWGYESFLEAIRDPNHPEHLDMLDWLGEDFDPEAFNLAETNDALATLS